MHRHMTTLDDLSTTELSALQLAVEGAVESRQPWVPPELVTRVADGHLGDARQARWHACYADAESCGVAYLSISDWDTDFFGLAMGELTLIGQHPTRLLDTLGPLAIEASKRLGVAHLRSWIAAPTGAEITALMTLGFEVGWSTKRIACALDEPLAALPSTPGIEVRRTTRGDLIALAEAVDSLPPYCWPQLDPAISASAQRAYASTRLRNCVEGGFSSVNITLLLRGQPVGFNASSHRLKGPVGLPCLAYERDTFLHPMAPPGLGVLLLRAALAHQPPSIRVVTGRVRRRGDAMLAAANRAGFRVIQPELMFRRGV